jgi:hypothetical protein
MMTASIGIVQVLCMHAPHSCYIAICVVSCLCPSLSAGPALHAEVGDTIEVVLRNNLDFAINMMPGGVYMAGGAPTVNPGDTYTAR